VKGYEQAPGLEVIPQGRGAVARAQALDVSPGLHAWGAIVASDSGGAIGACLTHGPHAGLSLSDVRRHHLRPTIDAVAWMLRNGEVFGQAAVDLWLALPTKFQIGGGWLPRGRTLHCGGEIVVPADEDELAALGQRWEREIARSIGIAEWED
jgi:hypothetical protein